MRFKLYRDSIFLKGLVHSIFGNFVYFVNGFLTSNLQNKYACVTS